MKRPMFITVRGREHVWCFRFDGDPEHMHEWLTDGLEVRELRAAIPAWAADAGIAKPMSKWQAFWQWMRLW